jgi:hypothetical protein
VQNVCILKQSAISSHQQLSNHTLQIKFIMSNQDQIQSHKNDIKVLEQMLDMYQSNTTNLNGELYAKMKAEIQAQINHCRECISKFK